MRGDDAPQRAQERPAPGASSPFSTSSSNSTSGPRTTARASSTRRRWPYDSVRNRSRRQARESDLPQHRADASTLRGRRVLQRQVGVVEARQHHLRHVERRLVALVAILPLGPEVGDAVGGKQRLVEHFASLQVIAPCSRPVGVGQTSPRSSLSRTVLPAPFGPCSNQRSPARTSSDVAQRPVPAQPHARVREFDAVEASRRTSGSRREPGPALAVPHDTPFLEQLLQVREQRLARQRMQ